MKYFLDEYINTLSARRQERVYDLLSAAKADKSDLDSIAARLTSTAAEAPIIIPQEQFGGTIDGSRISGSIRDVLDRLGSLYGLSNDISLLLDTHTSMLSSEIKALEDETDAMSKTIDNYAFTLSDNGAYDFSFMEPFNDETMRLDQGIVALSDRNGSFFSNLEQAVVNSASGTLTLSPDLDISHSMTGMVTNSNCGAYTTSDTGVSSALNSMVGNGWRVSVSSPRPISSPLIPGTSRQGAQFELELSLNTASPSDSIIVSPFSDRPFEILRMELLMPADESGHSEKITLVDSPKLIDKPTNFNFALSTVGVIRIVANQSVYTRGGNPPVEAEERHRKLYSAIVHPKSDEDNSLPTMSGIYRRNREALIRTVTSTLNKKIKDRDLRIFKAEIPIIDFDPSKGPYSVLDFMRNAKLNYGTDGIWAAHSEVNLMFRRMIHEKLFSSAPEAIGGSHVLENVPFYRSGSSEMRGVLDKDSSSANASSDARVTTNVDMYASSTDTGSHMSYDYDLGFRNIKIGRGYRIFRGAYVTKPLPAKSDSGEVKIKVDDTNFTQPNSDRDSIQITSVEYSVTNVSDPKVESDWIPIMPVGSTTNVTAERVYFEEGGTAKLRFPASRQAPIYVYRNGYIVDSALVTFTASGDKQHYLNFRLPVNTIYPNDIYTVDYSTYGDVSIVNFENWGADTTTLASAFDESGAGQGFQGTQNGRTVTLNYEPFVNIDSAKTFGVYSLELGFTGTYQPITIVMEDGTVASNQTNYSGRIQNSLASFDDTKTAYLHSGRHIIFNRNVTEKFTVYYQYLPSNLKVRIVLRVNHTTYVSPEVNSIQVKTKTKKPNPQRSL